MNWLLSVSSAVLLLVLVGCTENSAAPVVESSDFDHDHKHAHSDEIDHDHDHEDFEGLHSHGHRHGHRHPAAPHGGTLVSVGHTHHGAGVDQFHAEVLWAGDQGMTLYVFNEQEDGLQPAEVDGDAFDALVSPADDENGQRVRNTEFRAEGDIGEARFVATLDEGLAELERLTVVIPRLAVGGERLNFSFDIAPKDVDADEADSDEHGHHHSHSHGDETHDHGHKHGGGEHDHKHDHKDDDKSEAGE